MSPEAPPPAARFASFTVGDWLVEPKACHASRGDAVVKLRPQLVDLLMCLARRAGDIVLKDEILAEVWPGSTSPTPGCRDVSRNCARSCTTMLSSP